VDALRGFTIFWILGADSAAVALQKMSEDKGPVLEAIGDFLGDQFTHPEWEGFVFYDLIFPLLIFVTGLSVVFSLTRLVERKGMAAAHLRVLRRALLLFVLGIVFYGGLSKFWPDVRLMGVLQRIALCYLATSLLFLHLRPRALVAVFVGLLVGYWALLTFVPVPGVGAASYAPDVNLANWIDAQYLPGKKWDGTRDPEGLLSTLPAIATCLLGVFAGMLLTDKRPTPQQKSSWLMGAGAAMVVAGYLWGLQFPVIKAIWTSSYALVAGGYSLLLLGLFHQIVDVWGWQRWATVLLWIGGNAIALYFLNNIAGFERLASRFVGGDVSAFLDRVVAPGTGWFVAHSLGVVFMIALARFLYQRKIFLRL